MSLNIKQKLQRAIFLLIFATPFVIFIWADQFYLKNYSYSPDPFYILVVISISIIFGAALFVFIKKMNGSYSKKLEEESMTENVKQLAGIIFLIGMFFFSSLAIISKMIGIKQVVSASITNIELHRYRHHDSYRIEVMLDKANKDSISTYDLNAKNYIKIGDHVLVSEITSFLGRSIHSLYDQDQNYYILSE